MDVQNHLELSSKMDREYRQFEEDLNGNDIIQSDLARIDLWERESIDKIQKTAEIARNDLLRILDRTRNQLKLSLNKMNDEIQLNRESKNYTEMNLNQSLKKLRQILESSLTDTIIETNQSSIRLIKILDKKQSFKIEGLHSPHREKFNKIVGKILLSEDHRTAICSGGYWNGSNVSGNNLYSYGVHSIRFRIKKKGKNNLFFGIKTSRKESNPWNRKTPFAYGWWELPPNDDEDPTIRTDDEVTLTLDCDHNQIQFEHHRTNRFVDQSISSEQCPFPWKIAIVLYSPGDSVSILS